MATIRNERDVLLQATSPRLLSNPANYISLIPTTNTITNNAGVYSPSSVTIVASLNGVLKGNVSWVLSPTVTYTSGTNSITIQSSNISTGVSVTVTASLTFNGGTYTATTVITKKEAVSLSSTGVLTGEGGGTITALPYTSTTGGPPASATANYFTTSASDPVGGIDGAAHYNSATNVMWFKVAGVWTKGGTINADQITVGTLAAARIAAGSITADKITVSSLSVLSPNIGTVTSGSVGASVTINGTASSTVVSNATNGYTAFQDTVDFRVPGAPTNSPVISTITSSSSTVGTVDLKLTWTYTQGAIQADHFIIYYLEGTTNPTTSSPVLGMVTGSSRDITVGGLPMDKSYKFGIVAARTSSLGVYKTTIVTPWTRTGVTGNITANIDGTAPSGVKNANITLSSTGSLIGAGGGSITALPYSNVTGGPPASATTNFFTTSTSNPTGGVDGAAHYNSSTNVMWFKISGVWQQGGTINAGSITVGTLAAARIAANSITSDKLSVSSLSAISANLGTVTAGSITGSADLDITGKGVFKGAFISGGLEGAIHANTSASADFGVVGLSGNISGGAGIYGLTTYSNTSGIYGFAGTALSNSYALTGDVSGGSIALRLLGPMTITSTTLVSNLNADMVDGLHASKFVRTDTNSTVTGNIDVTGTVQTNVLRIDQTPATGVATATFSFVKPGSASTNSWVTINFNGTNWYVPVWPA